MNTRFKDYLQTLTPKRRDIAMEAVDEYLKGESENIQFVNTATKVYNLCHDLALEEVEHAEVILMRQNYKLIKRVRITSGGITETFFDIRLILKEALLANATIIAMVHNHPSGSIRPSKFDDELTLNAKKACDVMRIHLADHVIIADGAYYSYREQGRI